MVGPVAAQAQTVGVHEGRTVGESPFDPELQLEPLEGDAAQERILAHGDVDAFRRERLARCAVALRIPLAEDPSGSSISSQIEASPGAMAATSSASAFSSSSKDSA